MPPLHHPSSTTRDQCRRRPRGAIPLSVDRSTCIDRTRIPVPRDASHHDQVSPRRRFPALRVSAPCGFLAVVGAPVHALPQIWRTVSCDASTAYAPAFAAWNRVVTFRCRHAGYDSRTWARYVWGSCGLRYCASQARLRSARRYWHHRATATATAPFASPERWRLGCSRDETRRAHASSKDPSWTQPASAQGLHCVAFLRFT